MRKHLFKTLLALALVLISGNVWGESYKITFSNKSTSAVALQTTTQVSTFVGGGSEYLALKPVTSATYSYYGENNNAVRVGKKGNAGLLTLALSELGQVKAKSIVVNAQLYNTSKAATLACNGAEAQDVTAEASDLTFTLDGSVITSITFNSSNYMYVNYVTVNYTRDDNPTDPVAVTGVTLDKSTLSIEAGKTATLTATVAPANATNKVVTWNSSKESVATVADGTVTAVAEGEAVITVTTKDGSKTASCTVTVTEAKPTEALTTIEAIQEACVAAGKTETDATVKFDNWVVTGIKGGNNIYVSDGTKGFVIYAKSSGFAVGDVLSGTVACKVQYYSGNTYELTGVTSTTAGLTVSKGGTVTPKVMTLADVTLANQGTVVTLKDVDYDGKFFTDGTNKVQFYDAFGTKVSLNAGGKYDITGIVIPYITVEIAPRTADDVKSLSSQVAAESSWEEMTVSAKLGETVSNIFTTNSDGTITYTSSKTSVATVSSDGTITLVGAGSTTITAETAETENYFASSVSFTLVVTDPNSTDVTDVIVFDWRTDESGYDAWPSTEGESGAEYAINSFLGNTSGLIQLRDKENTTNSTRSGLVVSSSVGFVSKVVINWDSSTAAERTVDVYGKNSAYTSANDLWENDKGTKLGSMNKGTSTELNIDGQYTYIGLRSGTGSSGAIYIRSIEITWSKAYSRSVTEGEFGTICLPFDVSFGDTSGAKFYTVAGKTVSAGVPQAIVLDEVDKLAAGVPYIFQATDSKLSCKFTGSAVEEAGNAGGLYGTFADATAVESGKYIIYNNTVKMCGSDCTVDAFRAYIDMDEVEEATGAGAVSIRMNDATGISVLSKEADCKFYDLQGRSVDQPQRGIYVVNGQKVIVK